MKNKIEIIMFSLLFILFSSFVLAQDENVDVSPVPEPEAEPTSDPGLEPNPIPSEEESEPVLDDEGEEFEPEPEPQGEDEGGVDCSVLDCQPGSECIDGVGCEPTDEDGEHEENDKEDYCPQVNGFRIVGGECVPTQDGCFVEFGDLESCERNVNKNIHVPKGCYIVDTESGVAEYECEDDRGNKRYWRDVEKKHLEMKEKCNANGGLFDVIDGNPECILGGKSGFSGVVCPSGDAVEKFKRDCDGRVDFYLDENGCNAMSCVNDDFGRDYDKKFRERYDDDPVRLEAFRCKSRGGKFVHLDGKNKCFERENRGYRHIKFEDKSLDPVELLKIAIKIETVTISLESVKERLDDIANFYESKDPERSKVYLSGVVKIEGAIGRLEEIRFGLAENAENLKKEDRIAVLRDLQNTKEIIKDIALEILSGKRITREDVDRDKFERIYSTGYNEDKFRDFHDGVKGGVDILESIANCDQDSIEDPFVFHPEPGMTVRLEGLDDQGRCIMKPKPDDAPFDASIDIRLPPDVYKYFTGPEMLLRDDVECIGFGCQFMLNDIKSGRTGGGPGPEEDYRRFGEREFERHGPEGRKFFDDRGRRGRGPGPQDPIGICMEDCIANECGSNGVPPDPACVDPIIHTCEADCFDKVGSNDYRFEDDNKFNGHDDGSNDFRDEPPESPERFDDGSDNRFKDDFGDEFRDGSRDGSLDEPLRDSSGDFRDSRDVGGSEGFQEPNFFDGEGEFTVGNAVRRFIDRFKGG